MNKFAIKILAVDDEAFMLKILSRMLNNIGYSSVMTCDSGHGALALMDSTDAAPDMILLDLNMPVMDGLEFVRHLVERNYAGSLILISGEDERMQQSAEKLARAHKITVLGHLHKPATPEGLEALIGKWQAPQLAPLRAEKKVYDADEVLAAIVNGELVNYYQPKVMKGNRQLIGVETLVRWRHPQDGLVFPDQFIGVAEAHGLIEALTRRVMTEALYQTRVWQEMGLMLRVAVNVSMQNLVSLDFADFVVEQAAAAGVEPHQIMLEVTESQLMKDARAPLEILTRLRLKRFRLSIDDFGTGNSSLAQLRDIPFDELKIDQGFVHGAWNNDTIRVMFDASLGLAKQLQMEAVAEGVEDQQDWDFFCSTACDIAQGYFIARPMPADELPAWIESWHQSSKI